MRAVIAVAVLLATTACAKRDAVKPDLPGEVIVRTERVPVRETRYVQIPDHLLAEPRIPEGPLADCPEVAKARGDVIRELISQLRKIRAIRGTQVPAGGKR